jgi:hypothetical protein
LVRIFRSREFVREFGKKRQEPNDAPPGSLVQIGENAGKNLKSDAALELAGRPCPILFVLKLTDN